VTCNFDRERLRNYFKELYRVLKPRGKAVIVNLAEKSFDKIAFKFWGEAAVKRKQLPDGLTSE